MSRAGAQQPWTKEIKRFNLSNACPQLPNELWVGGGRQTMMRREKFAIANIYVPVKRRATLKPETVRQIAESMLEVGQQVPIQVRRDGDRFVLVEGLHRLEACKALGEETIDGYLTQAQKH
jgi:sulfiredoxin